MGIRAALLDIDGTLVDSNYEHVRAWYRAFAEQGITVAQAAIHGAIGMGGDKLVPHLLGRDADDPVAKKASEAHDGLFRRDYKDHIRPLPGVRAFLDRLRESGIAIALATSAKSDELEHYVALLGLEGQLAATVSQADVEQTKPAPEIFGAALERLGVDAAGAIAVGDTIWDGQAARHLGVRFVAVRTGGIGAGELREAGALAVYDDLQALVGDWARGPFAGRQVPPSELA